jgi:hypothetical protein
MASQLCYAGTIASASSAPYTTYDWTSVASMGASDTTYARITHASYDATTWTYLVRLTNFGFAAYIAAGSVINGITVTINGYGANGTNKPKHVQLTKDTTNVVGTDYGIDTVWSASPGNTRTFGGATDKWGTTWTVAEVTATTFGVHFANQAVDDNADVYIDYVAVTITWTPPVGGYYRALLGVGR